MWPPRFNEGQEVLYQGQKVILEEYDASIMRPGPIDVVLCHIIFPNGGKAWVNEQELNTALDRLANET